MNETPDIYHELPEAFFHIDNTLIRDAFPNPSLVYLKGKDERAIFVSILLHGNEHTGLEVMQRLLSEYDELPRSIIMFVGNVRATELSHRFLPDQEDFNRCWPGTWHDSSETTRLLQNVFDLVSQNDLFAAIDIHNNTGNNPHYACITDPNYTNQQLAARFNSIAVTFRRPRGVCTMAFDGVCPACTLECGVPGDIDGINHAVRFLEGLLTLEALPSEKPDRKALHLVQTLVTLKVPPHVSFGFDPAIETDLMLADDMERRNFKLYPTEEPFAITRIDNPLIITDQSGNDISREIIRIEEGKIFLNQSMMPAMLTHNKEVVRQDCLCYLMQDYPD